MVVHVTKNHSNQPAEYQCVCGYIALDGNMLNRHQNGKNHTGRVVPDYHDPISTMYRLATQTEKGKHNKERRKWLTNKTKPNTLQLDYQDWDTTETTEEESWASMNKKLKTTEEENVKLTERVKELEKAADIMAADLEVPSLGVPHEAALSGFEAAWTEQCQDEHMTALSLALFPDPPTRIQSAVVVPERNRHLSRNERVWRRASGEAIKGYNKKHRV